MKLDIQSATKELEAWLDFKKVSPRKREIQKDSIETIVDALCSGTLSFNEEGEFVQVLNFPIVTPDNSTDKLTYKKRITVKEVSTQLEKVKNGDIHGMISGYGAALTGQPRLLIGALDTEDFGVVGAIAVFFM